MKGKNFVKKNSGKKDFYDVTYFDLVDAMKEKVCPLCLVIQKREYKYVDTLFYELVNDPGVREKLRKSYGFCTKHAQLVKKRGEPLGIAIIYQDICSTLVERMGKRQVLFTPGEKCCVCKVVDEVQEQYIHTFLRNFSQKGFQRRYEQSFGLCMPHFLVVYSRFSKQEEKNIFKQYQLHALREYLPELEEFIRKHDYRFSEKGFGKEALSWRKVMDKIAGK